jgi:hypothetical protein
MKIAVIYKTLYGTTKQYAQWIAEELDAQLYEASTVRPKQLIDYDIVIYGGGLYAGGVIGAKLVAKNPCKSLVLFTVGLANPDITDFTSKLRAFNPDRLESLKVFHLRGSIDYGKLNLDHRGMMAIMKKETEKIPLEKRTIHDTLLLETYGSKCDFADKATILPLVDYVRALHP